MLLPEIINFGHVMRNLALGPAKYNNNNNDDDIDRMGVELRVDSNHEENGGP